MANGGLVPMGTVGLTDKEREKRQERLDKTASKDLDTKHGDPKAGVFEGQRKRRGARW